MTLKGYSQPDPEYRKLCRTHNSVSSQIYQKGKERGVGEPTKKLLKANYKNLK